ncbi:MAG: AtpZ/AtpI family protein [Candidatus Cloacimonadales bacterium]
MKNKFKPNWKNNSDIMKHFSLITQLGLVVVSALLLCFFLGLYIERKFPSGGIWLAAGTILGVLSGGLAAFRLLKKTILQDEKDDEE